MLCQPRTLSLSVLPVDLHCQNNTQIRCLIITAARHFTILARFLILPSSLYLSSINLKSPTEVRSTIMPVQYSLWSADCKFSRNLQRFKMWVQGLTSKQAVQTYPHLSAVWFSSKNAICRAGVYWQMQILLSFWIIIPPSKLCLWPNTSSCITISLQQFHTEIFWDLPFFLIINMTQWSGIYNTGIQLKMVE